MFEARKARRSAAKLRLLIGAVSGGGKTYSALLLAKGLGGKTFVIDTENGSSDLYEDLHDFEVIDLKPPFSPERYVKAIEAAEQLGAEVIIIDSVTHCWSGKGGCLELVDDIAKAKFRGNTWSAFSEITPRWRAFVDAIIRSRAHVICTGRSKTETAQVEENGRKKVVKLGMKMEARDGLEYEFTVVLDLVHDGHYATVTKDRTGVFTGDPKPVTVDTGRELAKWLAGSSPAKAAEPEKPSPLGWLARVQAATTVAELGLISDEADAASLAPQQRKKLEQAIAARHEQIEPEDDGQEPFDAGEVEAEANQ